MFLDGRIRIAKQNGKLISIGDVFDIASEFGIIGRQ